MYITRTEHGKPFGFSSSEEKSDRKGTVKAQRVKESGESECLVLRQTQPGELSFAPTTGIGLSSVVLNVDGQPVRLKGMDSKSMTVLGCIPVRCAASTISLQASIAIWSLFYRAEKLA